VGARRRRAAAGPLQPGRKYTPALNQASELANQPQATELASPKPPSPPAVALAAALGDIGPGETREQRRAPFRRVFWPLGLWFGSEFEFEFECERECGFECGLAGRLVVLVLVWLLESFARIPALSCRLASGPQSAERDTRAPQARLSRLFARRRLPLSSLCTPPETRASHWLALVSGKPRAKAGPAPPIWPAR